MNLPKPKPNQTTTATVAQTDDEDVVDDTGQPVQSVAAAPDDGDVVDDAGQPVVQPKINSAPIIAASQVPKTAIAPGPGGELEQTKQRLDAEKANSPRSVLGWIGNIPSSGLGMLEGGWQMVRHPVDTVAGLGKVALGGVQKAATWAGADPDRNAQHDYTPIFDAFLDQMKERYGGLDAIGNTIYTDPAGAALDVSGLLSGGSSLLGSRMPRTAEFLAAASRAIDPVSAAGKATRAAGRGAASVGTAYLGKSTGVGSEVVRTAAEGSNAFKAGMRGAITHEDVLADVQNALGQLVDQRRDNYRARLAQLPQQVTIDLKPVHQTMKDALKRFNIRVVPTREPSQLPAGLVPANGTLNAALPVPNSMIVPGKVTAFDLDFSRSALRHSPQEMNKVRAAFDDLATWGTRPGDTSPLGVDLLKQGLNEMVNANPGRGDAIVKAVHDRARTLLEQQVPGYAEMTSEYASASRFLDEVRSELSVGPNAKPGAGIRKLTVALNQRNDYRRHLIEALDSTFGIDIKGSIAGLEMQPVAPRGIVGPITVGAGGTALVSKLGAYISDPAKLMAALTGAATFSPRLVGETLAGIATARHSKAAQMFGAATGATRRVVYNPATYRFVEESEDAGAAAESQRKQATAEMHDYLTGNGSAAAPDNPSIPPPPELFQRKADAPSSTERTGPAEWPAPGARDENDALFMRRTSPDGKPLDFPVPVPPSELLPPHFTKARQTVWGAPVGGEVPAKGTKALGRFGLEFGTKERAHQTKLANTVMVDAEAADRPNVYTHELGHVAYEFDVPIPVKQTFQRMTNKVVMDLVTDLRSNGPLPNDPQEREAAFNRLSARYPRAVVYNFLMHPRPDAKSRQVLYHEAFSELFSQYMVNPTAFKKTYPAFYDYFRRDVFKGREYQAGGRASGGTKKAKPQPQPQAAAPEWDGDTPPGVTGVFDPANPDYVAPPAHPNEFSSQSRKSENADLLALIPPSRLLPPKFKQARTTTIGMPARKGALDELAGQKEGAQWGGIFEVPFSESQQRSEGYPRNIAVSRDSNEYESTLSHELGHSVWLSDDIQPAERKRFAEFYDKAARARLNEIGRLEWALEKARDAGDSKKAEQLELDINERASMFNGDPKIPSAVKYYKDDYAHAFAELFGQYIANPKAFKARYPDWYEQMRLIFGGKEYIERTTAEKAMLRLRGKKQLTPFEMGTDVPAVIPPPPSIEP